MWQAMVGYKARSRGRERSRQGCSLLCQVECPYVAANVIRLSRSLWVEICAVLHGAISFVKTHARPSTFGTGYTKVLVFAARPNAMCNRKLLC